MNYKAIIFDLDGVLISTKKIHFDCLNEALAEIDPKYVITEDEHLSIYDGLKTLQKLELLTKNKGLTFSEYNWIWLRKQELTRKSLETITIDIDLRLFLLELKAKGIKLACCSNAIDATVHLILKYLGVHDCFDIILSNDTVNSAKPYPEIYWTAMMRLGVNPTETLIVEDSPTGLTAAYQSGANVYRVDGPKNIYDIPLESEIKTQKWVDKKLNVLIPMAGAGQRFVDAGYSVPKPLIEVDGVPMIQKVIQSLNIDANYIFLIQMEHKKYGLDTILKSLVPNCKIVEINGITNGAAITTLLSGTFIDNDNPLLIANCDQLIQWNSTDTMYAWNESGVDGGILTFNATDPKWSYIRVENGLVREVAEKKAISDCATVGVYWWRNGSDYVRYACEMIAKDIRTNGEFYVCPVYNEAIADGKKIKNSAVQSMIGLGTPEDLKNYDCNSHS